MTEKFEKIYNEESDAIFRFCFTRVSDRDQALDLTQETFLRLWKDLQKGNNILNPRAFLFTITRHLIIDWYRKKKSLSLDSMVDNDFNSGKDFSPFDKEANDNQDIFLEVEGRYLLGKINDLGEAYRDLIYLRYVEDLSPQNIAKILGISTNAASVRINRGLLELRKKTGYDISEIK